MPIAFATLITLAALAAMGSGCASAPLHYHSLVPTAATSASGTIGTRADIEMRDVKVPPEVDRTELVVRQSDDELTILGNDVWIAPLRDEIKSALMQEIRQQLAGSTDTTPPPKPVTIHVDVERFESDPGRHALIQIAWRLTMTGSPQQLTLSCLTTATVDVAPGLPALVLGQQRAIAQVGDAMAASIRNLQRDGSATCRAGELATR